MKFKIFTYKIYNNGIRDNNICMKLNNAEKKLIEKGSQVIHSWHNETHYFTPKGYTWIFTHGDNMMTGIPCLTIRICKGKPNRSYFNQV